MDRRGFLASSASATLLTACATPRGQTSMAPVTLPRGKIAENRIIRTVAGLRPYRAAGFVVRAAPLGDKLLVHNYGHGGAGITLSWGSAKLAVDIGLAGHREPVAVIGAGVMGLSTARLAQERGHRVTIHAEALPPDTTSNIAGGQIHPASHYRESRVDDAWRAQYAAAMDFSWRRFQLLVGDDYGVRWHPTYEQRSGPPRWPLAPYYAGLEDLAPSANPFPVGPVQLYHTMYVETGRYLRQLTDDFLSAGGTFAIRRFAAPQEIAALPERVVFNCTGLGARALFGDEELEPVRGQLVVLLPQPEVDHAYSLHNGYMFPRPDGLLLGGTFERGEWDAVTTPEAIAGILAGHRHLNRLS
ncbi:MAG TPA: FAD-dependent oxidoreductase [Croceibacterium sp.]|nr:FAD-dependent oxidoreductase [Croceibacterium sp.]